ncbi:hypothetical protein G7Z17_g7697 [Cylindrodendrum hubeiense]|uniref:Uncharacterized protein n=1 Tax=Cylindrodendrum hubeiense TaxID=595255 RepID=A0A9P5HAY2_9HYPO|nr:hypothetical protein G7Z17_g7697 [Cylindrodendrum hubeiense]
MIPPRTQCCGTKLPSYLGFAILAFVNTIVPFIVFSANYLIIPYPLWVVILIETLPALTTKLLIPHFLHHVPYWMRPLTAGACWILVAIVTNVTPPNVAPPLRIFTSMLAASAAAAMEVSFLGMTRYYGKAGLAGWGAGVGAGAVFCAVLPFILTIWMEAFLRTFIDWIYVLTGAMLMGFFVILPGAPVNYPDTQRKRSKDDIEEGPEATLLMFDPLEELSRLLSTENRVSLIKAVIRPFMIPLFITFATQTIIFPGISRALPASPAFETFFSYFTTYGFTFQLGGFVSRTLTPLFRPRSTQVPFAVLGLAAAVVLTNATFSLFFSPVLIGMLAFCAGLMGGAIYMIIMDRVLEEKASEPGINQEFCLQVVGAGETAGTMCDEEGPPCGNCFVRGLEDCSFTTPQPTLSSQDGSAAEAQTVTSSLSPDAIHRFELELMHRWSTSTWKSLCTIPEDQQWIQVGVPRWGLKHEFLLHGVFCLSAFEVALCGDAALDDDPKVYVKLALEYYDRASRSYRKELNSITPDNLKAVYVFSSMAFLINMAIPQCESMVGDDDSQSIMTRMVALFDLLLGGAAIVIENIDTLLADPEADAPMKAGLELLNSGLERPLPSEIEDALTRANVIVDKGVPIPGEHDVSAREAALVRVQSYRTTVSALRLCYVEDSKEKIKGLCIAFPGLAGLGFADELKSSEPVALFVMLHWGVLLHHLGKTIWWAKTIGARMVLEISETLLQEQIGSPLAGAQELLDGIAWAREQTELPPFGDVMDKD